MPISQERLSRILQHHQQSGLMTSEGDKYMNQIRESKSSDALFDPDPSSFDNDGFGDEMWLSSTGSGGNQDTLDNYGNTGFETSKLPEAIKQSMLEKRIDTSVLGGKSVTEQLGLKPIKRRINESEGSKVQPQSSGQIDYSIIKAIVNECLSEQLKNLNVTTVGELKTIGISQGKIKLVDNKGNIFTADLVLKGNVNDKKK